MPNAKRFTDETWKEIVSVLASCFSMDGPRASRLEGNTTAELIAAIPYLAGCREPERTALAHLATYILAGTDAGSKVFDHKSEDNYDILARLAMIAGFEGGDPAIINRGMKILAKIMIEGYKRDVATDLAEGQYNPIASGDWDADEKISSLTSAIATVASPEMDAIVSSGVRAGWWGKG
jgi:hypothetical protein